MLTPRISVVPTIPRCVFLKRALTFFIALRSRLATEAAKYFFVRWADASSLAGVYTERTAKLRLPASIRLFFIFTPQDIPLPPANPFESNTSVHLGFQIMYCSISEYAFSKKDRKS